ncbi:MAG: type II toxin-antitoxin system HicA family toxin [Patescibacteria group bacterium]
MPKLPSDIKGKELVKILLKLGFIEKGQKGSHLRLTNPDGRWTQIPIHSKPIPRGTLRAILRQAGLNVEDIE